MEQIHRIIKENGQIVRKVFNIYSRDEIKDFDSLPHWKDGIKGLVRTDDGYAVDCLKVDRYMTKKGKELVSIVMSVGRMIATRNSKFLWERKREVRSFANAGYKTYSEKDIKKTRVKSFVVQYVKMFLQGKVNYDILADVVGSKIRLKKYLKDEKIKEMIKEEINQVLSKQGITAEFVLEQFKEAIEMAKNNRDPGAVLRAAENLAKMLEMYPTQTKQIQTLEYSLDANIQNMIQDYELNKPKQLMEVTNESK